MGAKQDRLACNSEVELSGASSVNARKLIDAEKTSSLGTVKMTAGKGFRFGGSKVAAREAALA